MNPLFLFIFHEWASSPKTNLKSLGLYPCTPIINMSGVGSFKIVTKSPESEIAAILVHKERVYLRELWFDSPSDIKLNLHDPHVFDKVLTQLTSMLDMYHNGIRP